MWNQIGPAVRITLFFTVLTGIIYPLAITGVTQVIFPHQANGSLITSGGKVVGSRLIGQTFTKPEYFHSRPSAAGNGYDGTASTGSNLGPTNQKLADRVKADVAQFREDNPHFTGPVPADLLTASGSGLDPDISPASAAAQIDRVASARRVDAAKLEPLIAEASKSRTLGFMGEPRVNVLQLNLALDRAFPRAATR
jgi:K+-transporting ATPase ATPase C chain